MIGKQRTMASVYLICDDKILLLYREGSRVVNQVWIGSAGGHFELEDENDAGSCVLRELYEELNITQHEITHLALRYITLRRTNDEIRQNFYFFADFPNGTNVPLASNEGRLQWFPLNQIENLSMPFSAKYMIRHWLEIGRHTDKLYAGIANRNTVTFSEMPAF